MLLEFLLLCGLTSAFLSAAFLKTSGPFDLFIKIKRLGGVVITEIPSADGSVDYEYSESKRYFSKVFTCPYCLAPYVSFLVVVLASLAGATELFLETPIGFVSGFMLFWFAVSGLSLLLTLTYNLLP